MTNAIEEFSAQIIREYHEMMERQIADEQRFRLGGSMTGRIYPPEAQHRSTKTWEMVVDGIPSSRRNSAGMGSVTVQPMICIKDEERCAEHCGHCSDDVQYNTDYWRSKQMLWDSQMHEYGVEWDPDIVF